MDGDRHAQLPGALEDGIERWIIDGDQTALRIAQAEPEHLGDLQAAGAAVVRELQQARHASTVVAILGLLVGERGEDDDLAGSRRGCC